MPQRRRNYFFSGISWVPHCRTIIRILVLSTSPKVLNILSGFFIFGNLQIKVIHIPKYETPPLEVVEKASSHLVYQDLQRFCPFCQTTPSN